MHSFWMHLVQFLQDPEHLKEFIDRYESWAYLIIFCVVFSETGLLIMWFLPGDTLLFAVGTLASSGPLDLAWALPILWLASVGGDSVNYWVGRYLGPKVFRKEHARFLDKENLKRAHQFYELNGGKTVFVGRFIPLIRCFAPFVAGIGSMRYTRFLMFSSFGTAAWVGLFVLGGYFFGKLRIVKDNFLAVCLTFALIGFVVVLSSIIRQYRRGRAARKREEQSAADQAS